MGQIWAKSEENPLYHPTASEICKIGKQCDFLLMRLDFHLFSPEIDQFLTLKFFKFPKTSLMILLYVLPTIYSHQDSFRMDTGQVKRAIFVCQGWTFVSFHPNSANY